MAETVEVAIYKLSLQGEEQFVRGGKILDIFSASGDKATISVEKLNKASRASPEGWNRIVASLDPAAKATMRMATATKQLDDYVGHGIGTTAEYAAFSEKMVNNLLKGVGVTDRAGLSFKEFSENFDPATSSIERLDSLFHQLSGDINKYVSNAELAQKATKTLAVEFNKR